MRSNAAANSGSWWCSWWVVWYIPSGLSLLIICVVEKISKEGSRFTGVGFFHRRDGLVSACFWQNITARMYRTQKVHDRYQHFIREPASPPFARTTARPSLERARRKETHPPEGETDRKRIGGPLPLPKTVG